MRYIYLYLASRSKNGVKLITVLQGESIVRNQITDVSTLELPPVWQNQISSIIQENKMLYEPWMESASSFNEIRARLKARGYSNLPMGAQPLLDFKAYTKAPVANTSSCKIKRTMLRRKK